MVNAVNVADLDHLWDPTATPLFTEKPPEWVANYLPRYCQSVSDRAASDCRGLVLLVRELQRDGFWERLFPDWETCCQLLFKRPSAWVEQVVEGVRVLHAQGHDGAVSAKQAITAQRAAEAALALPAEAEWAGDGRPAKTPEGNCDIITVRASGEGGTSAAYLAARLKKAGREDLLEQIGPEKQFRSVRAAAIEAGIIKPVPTIRVTSPEAIADRLVQHLQPDDLARLVALLTERLLA